MKSVWLVYKDGIIVAVCDTEITANKVIEHHPERKLKKEKKSIIADVIGDKLYYYL